MKRLTPYIQNIERLKTECDRIQTSRNAEAIATIKDAASLLIYLISWHVSEETQEKDAQSGKYQEPIT